MAALLAVAAVVLVLAVLPGPLASLLILAVPTTFAMPMLAAVAEWDAGASRRSGGHRVLLDTALVIGGAVVLTLAAALVIGGIDLGAAVSGDPAGPMRGLTTFPYAIPLGALTFVCFLQVSVVSEGRKVLPERLGPAAGRVVVLGCFAVAVLAYLLLANWETVPPGVREGISLREPGGPFPALEIATFLIMVTVWQAVYNMLGGWPFSLVAARGPRIALANLTVVALGAGIYFLTRDGLGIGGPQVAAAGGMAVAGCSLAGAIVGPRLGSRADAGRRRAALLGLALLLGAACYLGFRALGLAAEDSWTEGAPVELWMVIVGLNLVAGAALWQSRVLGRTAG